MLTMRQITPLRWSLESCGCQCERHDNELKFYVNGTLTKTWTEETKGIGPLIQNLTDPQPFILVVWLLTLNWLPILWSGLMQTLWLFQRRYRRAENLQHRSGRWPGS
jgi:hypothetical protein